MVVLDNVIYVFAFLIFFTSIAGGALSRHLLKKVLCLNMMQVSVIMFFLAIGYKNGAFFSPIYREIEVQYINPVPQVLMLTAIVVSFATTAFAVALCLKIKSKTGTIYENEIDKFIHKQNEL